MDFIDEMALLGVAVLAAQKFEFALYGIIAHLSHLPEVKKEKRFRDLTPEKFLRGDIKYLKATLGQLGLAFGGLLMLNPNELKSYIDDRNLISHNYWRKTRSNIKGTVNLTNPEVFLNNFIASSDQWISIINGLLNMVINAAAEKEGRLSEINFSLQQKNDIAAYELHTAMTLITQIDKSI
jgi:hypothetical protein